MPAPDNSSVVQEFYDQWNSGAIDFDRLVHEDVTNHQPDKDPETGLDRFRQAIAGVMGAVPDSKWTTLNLIEEGELVACHKVERHLRRNNVSRDSNPPGQGFFRRAPSHISGG